MQNLDLFLSRLEKVRKSGKRWMACCPAHNDKSPSLSIRVDHRGLVRFDCFAGCNGMDILSAVGLTFKDINPGEDRSKYTKEYMELKGDSRTIEDREFRERLIVDALAADLRNDKKIQPGHNTRALEAMRWLKKYERYKERVGT